MKQAVLTIFIPKQGFVRQGKVCLIDGKPCFVANMTARKEWKVYSGYSIAKRILDALPRGTKIIYKRIDQQQYFITNKTKFQKKGILVSFGAHSQWVLPLKNWIVKHGILPNEPHQLPVISLDKWTKTGVSGAGQTSSPQIEDFSIPLDIKLRLKKVFDKEIRYA